ncbi:MAG: type II secretion system protein M [Burkholderiaceae bacterium]|nr:type II secretion system protein M [Burkholderiaceae bacterium]
MIESLLLKWSALSPRDRRMLVLAGGFLLVVFTWLVAFEPAWDGRRQLARELPALRSDLAQMDQLAEEARQAASAPRQGVESASQLRTRVEETLADAGLSGSVAQLELNGEMVEVRFRQADFERWLYWLDAAVRETRMRVVDLAITREAAGVISGRLALEVPRRGG